MHKMTLVRFKCYKEGFVRKGVEGHMGLLEVDSEKLSEETFQERGCWESRAFLEHFWTPFTSLVDPPRLLGRWERESVTIVVALGEYIGLSKGPQWLKWQNWNSDPCLLSLSPVLFLCLHLTSHPFTSWPQSLVLWALNLLTKIYLLLP